MRKHHNKYLKSDREENEKSKLVELGIQYESVDMVPKTLTHQGRTYVLVETRELQTEGRANRSFKGLYQPTSYK